MISAAAGVHTWWTEAWPVIGPILAIIVTASATGVWAMINRRGSEKVSSKIPLPPTWPEMWARLDRQDTIIERLEGRVETLEEEKRELVEHVVVLENMIPEPPPRPVWMTQAIAKRQT